jgi:iron-sulfur cluster assembly protein
MTPPPPAPAPAALTLTSGAKRASPSSCPARPKARSGSSSPPPPRLSGLAYSVDYVTEEKPFDEKIVTPGGTFYVDGASILI